jgi:hypothetical protein
MNGADLPMLDKENWYFTHNNQNEKKAGYRLRTGAGVGALMIGI